MANLSSSVVMDIDKYSIDNFDNVRERTNSTNKVSSRSIFISSSTSSISYYKRIVINNDLSDQEHMEPVDVMN